MRFKQTSLLAILSAFSMFFPLVLGPALAQNVKVNTSIEVAQSRTLFDLLFGPPEETTPTQIRRTPAPAPHSSEPHDVVAEPVAKIADIVEKTEGATRLAIFGDSMAIDLAKAFQREFFEDPNLIVVGRGVGSSGFVRDDFFDWNSAVAQEIASDSFDLAVVIIGINDRQAIGQVRPLSNEWKILYRQRIDEFLGQFRAANKPVIWVGLPPMRNATFSSQIGEISAIQRLAAFTGGVEFVDIYDRYASVDGSYSLMGPNLKGEEEIMRKNDGIHFSSAGSNKLVFYINQTMRPYYSGGQVSVAVADPLEGTDGLSMVRPPFQGNGQFRLLQVAGAVVPLTLEPVRAMELVLAPRQGGVPEAIDIELLMQAPVGRADEFGVGIDLGATEEEIEAVPQ